MESEQREEPDDDPAPLPPVIPPPPLDWKQHRIDERRRSWATAGNVFGVILVAIMIIFGLAVAGVVVLVYIGMSHYGSNK
jgi:hypothetical protein